MTAGSLASLRFWIFRLVCGSARNRSISAIPLTLRAIHRIPNRPVPIDPPAPNCPGRTEAVAMMIQPQHVRVVRRHAQPAERRIGVERGEIATLAEYQPGDRPRVQTQRIIDSRHRIEAGEAVIEA